MMTGLGFGMGFFGLILMVLFWGGLIALAVWLVKALFVNSPRAYLPPSGDHLTPREILDQRYARGEIDREAYERMKQDLQ
jgi:putative membrane protein